MALRTPEQYLESLRDGRVVYFEGEKVEDVTKHPILSITNRWVAMDYVLSNDPKYQDFLTDVDEEGDRVSFVLQPQRSKEDLIRLREIVKFWARVCLGKPTGAKFVAKDGLCALTVVSKKVDKKYGTDYSRRVEAYRKYWQKNDLAVALAMTDVKGDRSLRPSRQVQHKDFYVRIVEKRKDGIVVSGAKTHISQAPACNELLVLPCRAMTPEDKEYAVAFAIPVNTKGVTLISAQPEVHEGFDPDDYPIAGSVYINDALVVFENVFVPEERVFLKGEWEFAGDIAYMFANFHRLSAETYKAVELELLTGAAILMAEYNGVDRAPHIRERITWLIMYAEMIEALSRAAVEYCVRDEETGLVYPNPMIANICKYQFAVNWHQATQYVQDIAGGIVATVPSFKDFKNPETRSIMEKYFAAKAGIPTEHRLKMVKLIKDLTSTYEDVLTIHAEGSLAAQRLSIYALAEFDRYKAAAKRAARIEKLTGYSPFDDLPAFPPEL